MENFNVDFVFPYLNPDDPNWREIYSYCKGEAPESNNVRFRDFSLLKYIFRSIELYAPWVNRICIIVQSKSQVEGILKESSNLRIIEHKEFIPEKYLPVFNSNTIEMFLPKIKGLNEHILYSNDDLIFFNSSTRSNFFMSSKTPLYAFTGKNNSGSNFSKLCKRLYKLITSKYPSPLPNNGNFAYLKQWHGAAAPLLFSDMEKCYEDFEDDILKSLTMFRDCSRNLNQYIYGLYSFCKGHSQRIDQKLMGTYFSMDDYENVKDLIFSLKKCTSKMVCINDTERMTDNCIEEIYKFLDEKFPDKSIYEV